MTVETSDTLPKQPRPKTTTTSAAANTAGEALPCPRCESTNTKFCYYNNYNHSQPRHFCKSCRRYWTQGGALRNVPVGGGTRKSSKRAARSAAHTATATTASATTTTTTSCTNGFYPLTVDSLLSGNKYEVVNNDHLEITKENLPLVSVFDQDGSFLSLFNSQQPYNVSASPFGFGSDQFGFGYADPGFGVRGGSGFWGGLPLMGNYIGGGGGDSTNSGSNTWQQTSGGVEDGTRGGEWNDADGFSWPGNLAISTPGGGSK